MTKVRKEVRRIFFCRWCTCEKTLRSSMKMRLVKVMLTMFTKESLNQVIERSIIAAPWKMEIQTQVRKVLRLSARPFCRDLYKGGNFITDERSTSLSTTREKTGIEVKMVAYPIIKNPLNTGMATEKKIIENTAYITDMMRPR
jgi:hypothetical protein